MYPRPDALPILRLNGVEAAHQHSAAPRLRLASETIGGGGRRLIVTDNGPGVPPAIRQEVFLPFFTTRAKGTGVGLNLARQIVVAHGGGIEVTDAAGGGAQFERSEEHTSELQSLMRISYAVFCLKTKRTNKNQQR